MGRTIADGQRREAAEMTEFICEAERRLGLRYINIAARDVKEHLGRHVSGETAIVLFDRPGSGDTIVGLWDVDRHQAITSETLWRTLSSSRSPSISMFTDITIASDATVERSRHWRRRGVN
jgi:hypothetical protein